MSSLAGSVLDTVIFFSIAFSASLAFIAPGVDVAWANEAVPLLGRGPVAPLWMSASRSPISWSSSRIAVFALAPFRVAVGLATLQRRENCACLLRADAGTIEGNRNQRKEVIQCLVRLWSVRPG